MKPAIVPCANGVFEIPLPMFEQMRVAAAYGMVFVREDEDSMTISADELADGKRRQLHPHYRAHGFREATRLVIVPMPSMLKVMPVHWRVRRRPDDAGID
jgi:hypothetical protein